MEQYFKHKLKNIREQDKKKFPYFKNDLSVKDLIDVYNEYEGRCVFTGKNVIPDPKAPVDQRVSFDRIDNDIPHYKWNLQLTSIINNRTRGKLNNNIFIKYHITKCH